MKTQEDTYRTALWLFMEFESGGIAIETFRARLKELAHRMEDIDADFLISEFINPQFDLYIEDPDNNGYLLSTSSSGSLLTQFEHYEE